MKPPLRFLSTLIHCHSFWLVRISGNLTIPVSHLRRVVRLTALSRRVGRWVALHKHLLLYWFCLGWLVVYIGSFLSCQVRFECVLVHFLQLFRFMHYWFHHCLVDNFAFDAYFFFFLCTSFSLIFFLPFLLHIVFPPYSTAGTYSHVEAISNRRVSFLFFLFVQLIITSDIALLSTIGG